MLYYKNASARTSLNTGDCIGGERLEGEYKGMLKIKKSPL
jgi:hypothetical protein